MNQKFRNDIDRLLAEWRETVSIEKWLELAAEELCDEPRERIRSEIETHYYAAKSRMTGLGMKDGEAHRAVMRELGSPFDAAKKFQRIYGTRIQIENREKWLRRAVIGADRKQVRWAKLLLLPWILFGVVIFLWLLPYKEEILRPQSFYPFASMMAVLVLTPLVYFRALCPVFPVIVRRFDISFAVAFQVLQIFVFSLIVTCELYCLIGGWAPFRNPFSTLSNMGSLNVLMWTCVNLFASLSEIVGYFRSIRKLRKKDPPPKWYLKVNGENPPEAMA